MQGSVTRGGQMVMTILPRMWSCCAALITNYWGSLPELMEVIALAREGRITAHVERFSLADAPKAYAAMAEGTLEGRAVRGPVAKVA